MRTLLLGLLAVAANAKNVRGTRETAETSREEHDKEEAAMYDWWCDTMGHGDSSIACITREMREITRRAHRNMTRITTIDDDDMKRRPEAEQQEARDAMARAFRDQMREGRRRTHVRETSGDATPTPHHFVGDERRALHDKRDAARAALAGSPRDHKDDEQFAMRDGFCDLPESKKLSICEEWQERKKVKAERAARMDMGRRRRA